MLAAPFHQIGVFWMSCASSYTHLPKVQPGIFDIFGNLGKFCGFKKCLAAQHEFIMTGPPAGQWGFGRSIQKFNISVNSLWKYIIVFYLQCYWTSPLPQILHFAVTDVSFSKTLPCYEIVHLLSANPHWGVVMPWQFWRSCLWKADTCKPISHFRVFITRTLWMKGDGSLNIIHLWYLNIFWYSVAQTWFAGCQNSTDDGIPALMRSGSTSLSPMLSLFVAEARGRFPFLSFLCSLSLSRYSLSCFVLPVPCTLPLTFYSG